MNRKLKVIAAIVVVAAFTAAMLLTIHRDHFHCTVCLSRSEASYWTLGLHGVQISTAELDITRTAILDEFFDADHEHDWDFMHGESTGLIRRAVSDGGPIQDHTDSAYFYCRDAGFRDHLRDWVEAGRITERQREALLLTPIDEVRLDGIQRARHPLVELDRLIVSDFLGEPEREYQGGWFFP